MLASSEFFARSDSYPEILSARDRVTMAEAVLHQDGSRRVSDRFPGALGRNPTRQTDRCDLRYGLDQSPYRLPAIIVKLLTDLGKIEQTAEARMWLSQLRQAYKQRDFYVENVGINRVNLTLTVRTLSAKPGKRSLKNAVFTVNDKTRRKR